MASDAGRLLELCAQALALPGGARSAFLDSSCDGDADLRLAVEALLAEETRARDFLQTPAWLPGRDSILPGQQLGPYEIVSLVGSGGMGEVYRARDTRLGRSVAVKVLPQGLAVDPGRRARLRREGRAVSALNHPHICTLYDIGSDDGLDYLVMEYLEGETLAAHVSRGPVALGTALEYAAQMADAVAFAHARGLIHRDLKPANVMLTPSGAKILDFGIAKIDERLALSAAPDRSLTGEGLVVGTLAYMAPEQLRGQAADERSDIFSLGAVLYEMFSGRRAFQGETDTSVIAAILETDPPPIVTLQPGTPASVDRVVGRCLQKQADTRWPRASDLAQELRRLRAKESAA
ncbi:MAG: serine/threonine-protein kinase, partial [Acidobacteriota bacterium]